MAESIILKFNNRSRLQSMVSSHDGKIVMIDKESPIQDPIADVPYLCTFKVYDTNPSSPVKGARIVDVIQAMVVDNVSLRKQGDKIHVTLFSGTIKQSCTITKETFDPRVELKRTMKAMGCAVDYAKIDKIMEAVRRKMQA